VIHHQVMKAREAHQEDQNHKVRAVQIILPEVELPSPPAATASTKKNKKKNQ